MVERLAADTAADLRCMAGDPGSQTPVARAVLTEAADKLDDLIKSLAKAEADRDQGWRDANHWSTELEQERQTHRELRRRLAGGMEQIVRERDEARAEVDRLTVRLDDAEAERAEAVDAYLRAELAELTEMRRQRDETARLANVAMRMRDEMHSELKQTRATIERLTVERDEARAALAEKVAELATVTRSRDQWERRAATVHREWQRTTGPVLRARDEARAAIERVAAYVRDRACAHLTMVPLVEVDQALRGAASLPYDGERVVGRTRPDGAPQFTTGDRVRPLGEAGPERCWPESEGSDADPT